MKYTLLLALAACAIFLSCSKEKSESLPDLPAVTVPLEVAGQYSGQLPCDNCKARMVRVFLDIDNTAKFIQTMVRDSMVVDTFTGKYSVANNIVSMQMGDSGEVLRFERNKLGNMSLLTGTGAVYKNSDGERMDLIRIFTIPKSKVTKPRSSSAETK